MVYTANFENFVISTSSLPQFSNVFGKKWVLKKQFSFISYGNTVIIGWDFDIFRIDGGSEEFRRKILFRRKVGQNSTNSWSEHRVYPKSIFLNKLILRNQNLFQFIWNTCACCWLNFQHNNGKYIFWIISQRKTHWNYTQNYLMHLRIALEALL